MLTKPQSGWSDFSLEGTSVYGLSYLDDVGIEWVEQAIHGLETLCPFCVHGNLEPGRMLCLVSYWKCYIFCEHDEFGPVKEDKDKVFQSLSHTSMIDFCQYLYDDISGSVDEWASFVDYDQKDFDEKRQRLAQCLARLKELIAEKEACFGPNRWFS